MYKRVFLIVMDGVGVGNASDAKLFNDEGANTLGHITENGNYNLNVLCKLGLINLVNNNSYKCVGFHTDIKPVNPGKDSLDGHYEMMGIIESTPFNVYPDGFPIELISEIQQKTGREVIGNVVASGTTIINDLGQMHMKTGALIVYTSADSVLQVAAHEQIIPVEELYNICEQIREITNNEKYKIGRIIARPFVGKENDFVRTTRRKDFALDPPYNYLDILYKNGYEVFALGKIKDIFNNKSITKSLKTTNNIDGLQKLVDVTKSDFTGLCFLNLNDFDSLYGHRRDKDGFLKALEEFNHYLPIFLNLIKDDDLVIITADHGNDPTHTGTNHTRENVPLIVYSKSFKKSGKLLQLNTLSDIGTTIIENFNLENDINIGTSFLKYLK